MGKSKNIDRAYACLKAIQFANIASRPTRPSPSSLRRLLQIGNVRENELGFCRFRRADPRFRFSSDSQFHRSSVKIFGRCFPGLVPRVLRGHTQGRKSLADNSIDPSTCETCSFEDRYSRTELPPGGSGSVWNPVLSLETHWPPGNQRRRSAMPFLLARQSSEGVRTCGG